MTYDLYELLSLPTGKRPPHVAFTSINIDDVIKWLAKEFTVFGAEPVLLHDASTGWEYIAYELGPARHLCWYLTTDFNKLPSGQLDKFMDRLMFELAGRT